MAFFAIHWGFSITHIQESMDYSTVKLFYNT